MFLYGRGNDRSKRIVASVGAVALAFALVAGAAAVAGAHTARVGVADSDYTLVLDADNTLEDPTTGSGTVYTTAGNPVAFGCTSATATDSACMTLTTGGTLYNTDAISGISSISSVADQDLTLEYWWSDETEAITVTLLAGGSFKFTDGRPSYFRVTAGTADTLITSLTIKYTCSAEASPDSLSDTTAEGCVIEYDSATGTYVVTGPTSSSVTTVHVPAYYDDGTNGKRPVASFADGTSTYIGAFYGCSSLTSVDIPSTISEINSGLFNICTSLSSITIPDSVTTIGASAFNGCTALASVEMSSSLVSLASFAFGWCTSLESINIPASTTSIDSYAFANCPNLESITVDEANAYYESVDDRLLLNEDLTTLMVCAVAGLTTFTIPSTVTTIGPLCCFDVDSVTSIDIPSSVTKIGQQAFAECDSLASVTISSSLSEIAYGALMGCPSLSYIEVDDASTTYSSSDDNRLLLTSDGTEIFRSAMSGLSSYAIPSTVTAIGSYAFMSSGISSVTIPTSVTSIGDSAFSGAASLSTITYKGTSTQWAAIEKGTSVFENVAATVVSCTDKTVAI